jgi:acyl-coenzyme A thioesterase PaaI-like protein
MDLPSHQLAMTVLMTPDNANFSGHVHGGTVLKLLDQVACACASRCAQRYVVTLSVGQVTFRQPIHVSAGGGAAAIARKELRREVEQRATALLQKNAPAG